MSFQTAASSISLFGVDGSPLLRRPQHGAALAVAAHFTARSEPAVVALPTGVGKTTVMTLLPYLLGASRMLIVVPTKLLREQIREEVGGLRILRSQQVVPQAIWSPRVEAVRERTTGEEWERYRVEDVVIAAPNSLVIDGHCEIPTGMFDLVLFDEAHHTPADTWTEIAEATSDARQVLFTATPYRRDEQRIDGTVVYEFSLGEAVAQGFVAPVDLQLIDEGNDPDQALIDAVASLVLAADSEYFETPFIARTNSKPHARELQSRYAQAGLDVRLVLDDVSLRTARSHIAAVREGEAAGLIMVGVLGEGFDFPAIKLAAYHRAHRSLPATLQFLGRISRVHPDGPQRGLVLATQEAGGEETQRLYQNDAQWAKLIPQLADDLFQREARRALFERQLQTGVQGEVSPANVRPKFSVDIHTVPEDFVLDVAERLEQEPGVVQWWQTQSGDFVVIIRQHSEKPAWLYDPVLVETEFELQCAIHARQERLLIVSSSRDTGNLLSFVGAKGAVPVSPDRLYAMLNAQGVEVYFNVGMRSVEIPNEKRAAYMINAGQSVGNSIRPEDMATYTLGHAIARINDNGRRRAFGISIRRARVWMPRSEPLADFHEWSLSLARLLHRSQPATMADGLNLRPQQPMQRFPELAIAAAPGSRLFAQDTRLQLDGIDASIADLSFAPTVSDDRATCTLRTELAENVNVELRVDVHGAVTLVTPDLTMLQDGAEVDATTALSTDPFAIFFGDGSSCRGPLLSTLGSGIPAFPATQIQLLSWENVDTAHEVEADAEKISIFTYLESEFARTHPNAIVINDNNSYELADIIVINDLGAHVEVQLVHCKGAPTKSEQVDQLYDVVGQAQRSMRWVLNRSLFWTEVRRRHLERQAFQIKADPLNDAEKRFEEYALAAPPTHFNVLIAQPGLFATALRVGTAPNVLLSSCKASADAAGAAFTVLCSAR